MGVVLIASHPSLGTRRCALDGEVQVGSDESNQLVLPSPVERRHARFLYRDGRVIVTDIVTANGTWVNGQRLTQARIITPADRIRLQDWELKVDPIERPEAPFAGRSPRESELLGGLAAAPSDDALRQVYGDFLEENGFPVEAEVLSIEREIRAGDGRIDAAELGRLGFRLRTLTGQLSFAWRAVATRPRIEGCLRPAQCPRFWDALVPTKEITRRTCNACAKTVHFAQSIDIARANVAEGRPAAVDLAVARYPRDLEVALARIPAPPTADGAVTGLAFFQSTEPPGTVGALLESLEIRHPNRLEGGATMGHLQLPAPTARIGFVALHYHWDMYHQEPRQAFREIQHVAYSEVSIAFQDDGDLVESWLEARYGGARIATRELGGQAESHRIYGNWVYRAVGPGCFLEWHAKLPDWALPATNSRIALKFLNDLAHFLREDPTHRKLVAFASRPPAQSGINVTGPLNKTDFWLAFEPRLSALEVAHALELGDVYAASSDVHMSNWRIRAHGSPLRLGFPRYGKSWIVEVTLDGWPSGGNVPNVYAGKRMTAKDRAHALQIRPYDKDDD